MKFKENDVVVHEVYGVGTVVGIEELQWKNKEQPYFYVIAIDEARIWVPVEQSGECHIRPLTPKEELTSQSKVFIDKPSSLENDRFGRHQYLHKSSKNPSFSSLCKTVRDLTAHGWQIKLTKNESDLLSRKTDQLVSEWALSAKIPKAQAKNEVVTLLNQLREIHGPESS